MTTNFDTYIVFMPTRSEGIDYGYVAPVHVLALDEKDAVQNAVDKWWSGTLLDEGTAIVVKAAHATAYVLGEIRGVEIVHETAVPDLASKGTT